MRWSIRLGRVLGIDIYVHLTFLLLLAWVVISAYNQTHSVARALFELAFICLVFATVVMHEYGHALTARQFGVKTRDITLLPIGGVAR
ncbi:MAG TPA: site-2 protease family protein, partial [Pirellulaceae bacterium]|nr:site-2 protease family protein [Pirellulaceae bacterium]